MGSVSLTLGIGVQGTWVSPVLLSCIRVPAAIALDLSIFFVILKNL